MAWGKPLDEVELVYIRESWPRLSCAEIAEKLGRTTRCVQKAVARMGLREPGAGAPRAADAPPAPARADAADAGDGGEQDELAELREAKRMLKRAMREAGPQSLPKLSAEFRETVARISELEGGADGSRGGSAGGKLAGIIGFVPVQPS